MHSVGDPTMVDKREARMLNPVFVIIPGFTVELQVQVLCHNKSFLQKKE